MKTNTVVQFPRTRDYKKTGARTGSKGPRIPDLFPRVKAAALTNAEELVPGWLPDGKRRGPEWMARNPRRTDNSIGSFKVNMSTGKWADFATDDRGSDLISLYAFVNGTRQIEAALELAGQLGIAAEPATPQPRKGNRRYGSPGNGTTGPRQAQEAEQRRYGSYGSKGQRHVEDCQPRREGQPQGRASATNPEARMRKTEQDEKARKEAAAKTAHRYWEQAGSPQGMEVFQAYMEARSLAQIDATRVHDCRVHPAVPYWHDGEKLEKLGTHPAILFLVRDYGGDVVGMHRLYLAKDGSDKVKIPDPANPWKHLPAKKAMSFGEKGIAGAAIRLTPEGEGRERRRLHVAEGPETALAVWALLDGKAEVWSTISAQGMSGLKITPDRYKEVIIWADKDRSKAGIKAAETLATRLEREGLKVKVKLPKGDIPSGAKSVDWLDVQAGKTKSRWSWFF